MAGVKEPDRDRPGTVLELLQKLERRNDPCPWCKRPKEIGHTPKCKLKQAIWTLERTDCVPSIHGHLDWMYDEAKDAE